MKAPVRGNPVRSPEALLSGYGRRKSSMQNGPGWVGKLLARDVLGGTIGVSKGGNRGVESCSRLDSCKRTTDVLGEEIVVSGVTGTCLVKGAWRSVVNKYHSNVAYNSLTG